jgi:AcrR family transcriptional regulator
MTAPAGSIGAGRPRDEGIRQRVLDAASQLLSQHSLETVTIDDIASAAKVSKKAIYARWDSKETVLMDALVQSIPRLTVQPSGNARADFEAIALELLARPVVELEVQPKLASLSRSNPALAQHFLDSIVRPQHAEIRAILETAQSRGEIAKDAHLDLTVRAFLGTLLLYRVTGSIMNAQLTPAELRQMVRELIDTLWHGLEPRD